MNKLILIITIVLTCFSISNAQANTQSFNWKEFVSEEGKFKATFPIPPVKSVQEVNGLFGKLEHYKFEVSLSEPEVYFGVSYGDFPNILKFSSLEALRTNYDNVRDGMVNVAKDSAKLISEKDVYASNNLGRELVLKFNNGVVITHRMFLIENRQYQVTSSTKLMDNADIKRSVEKFENSFQLIDQPTKQ